MTRQEIENILAENKLAADPTKWTYEWALKKLYSLHLKSKIEMLQSLIDDTDIEVDLADAVYSKMKTIKNELNKLKSELLKLEKG